MFPLSHFSYHVLLTHEKPIDPMALLNISPNIDGNELPEGK